MTEGDVIAISLRKGNHCKRWCKRYNKARTKGLGDKEGKEQKFLEVGDGNNRSQKGVQLAFSCVS